MPRIYRQQCRTPELWRVKNWREGRLGHPIDPGWDDGVYCVCHREFRTQERERGEVVVDCVDDGLAAEEGYIARSYFVISDWDICRFSEKGRKDLFFSDYYFCDGPVPVRVPRPTLPKYQRQYYRGIPLSEEKVHHLLNSPSYVMYSVSGARGPASVHAQDWRKMLDAKRAAFDELEGKLRERRSQN